VPEVRSMRADIHLAVANARRGVEALSPYWSDR